MLGCPVINAPSVTLPEVAPSESALHAQVRRTLEWNQANRTLSTELHGAWQILHGVLAYGQDFVMQTPSGPRPTVAHLLQGGTFAGFQPELGDRLGDPPRRGIRMEVEPTTKVGQGHRDQWLAILAQCGLPPETEIGVDGETSRVIDWVRQAEYDVPLNLQYEYSWTLIGLTAYRPTTHRWVARDGNEYSIESLLASELEQDLATSACGGTHRLIGVAMALHQRKREAAPIVGVWARAQEVVDEAIAAAQQNQNPDGSYSVAYLHRQGWARDLGESIGTTGHVVEFLAIAADDATLQQPWVERSVRRLCQMIDQCQGIDLECGGLYHALHGLALYRDRGLTEEQTAARPGSTGNGGLAQDRHAVRSFRRPS